MIADATPVLISVINKDEKITVITFLLLLQHPTRAMWEQPHTLIPLAPKTEGCDVGKDLNRKEAISESGLNDTEAFINSPELNIEYRISTDK